MDPRLSRVAERIRVEYGLDPPAWLLQARVRDRRVTGEHGELALDARHDHLGGVLREQHALGRYQLELEGARHIILSSRWCQTLRV